MKITFENCGKRFFTWRGFVEALRSIHLQVADGEFFIVLGPSGCGKSTLLNLAAGLEKPTAGEIRFDENIVASPGKGIFLPPKERNVAMVFQSYALYPHLDVFHNIAFPLKVAREKTPSIERAVKSTAEMLEITDLLNRKPAELSGGQRQRVAIARALVRRPDVLLLDEPLSNLDPQLRTATRGEIKRLQNALRITTLYVTHDQIEAMTLGDRIALLKEGCLVQVGTPEEMYDYPQTPFAATFIGSPPMNILEAEVAEVGDRLTLQFAEALLELPREKREKVKNLGKGRVLLGIRPEHIALLDSPEGKTLSGMVQAIEPLGRENLLHIAADGLALLVLSSEKRYHLRERVHLSFNPARVHLFDPGQK